MTCCEWADPRLSEFGLVANLLRSEQAGRLDEQGYVILEDVIGEARTEALRRAFDRISEEEGEEAGTEVAQMDGVRRLADLVNKDEAFDSVYVEPVLLAAVGLRTQTSVQAALRERPRADEGGRSSGSARGYIAACGAGGHLSRGQFDVDAR